MWRDDFLTIHFDQYGFTLDTNLAYISLSWLTLGVLVLSVVGYKITRKQKKGKK